MKRTVLFALLGAIFLIMSGCSQNDGNKENNGRMKIVATIFPEYDWVKEILGDKADRAELTMLLDNGVELHSYQPTVDDILKLSDCDLFIYVGGESDGWVEDALKEAANKDMVVISLMETLKDRVKEEEIVEGMETKDESDHESGPGEAEGKDQDHDDSESRHHHSGEIEYDEHVWLSVKNASVVCDKITEALSELDPEYKDSYIANNEAYKKRLAELDGQYRDTVAEAPIKTLLFGDRFPFRYLTEDYGLDYYAAFAGCEAETEASFETIVFLAGKVDELGIPAILTIENGDRKLAETIKENTTTKEAAILTLDSMQAATSADIDKGNDYISIMKKNLDVLKKALGL